MRPARGLLRPTSPARSPSCAARRLAHLRLLIAAHQNRDEFLVALQQADEAALFERIFGHPPPQTNRGR